ncbi:MAG: transketolase [Oscillospiraceae bacterium]|nr:transketolase [Oscillospiraceae bacterium]
MSDLRKIAFERRLDVLEMIHDTKAGHIGGSMSCMDILVALYYEIMDAEKIRSRSEDRDWFILSKGHCGEALYAVLADKGFFPKEELGSFAQFNTRLPEHPSHHLPGIEIGTGALGHGLSAGVGVALSLRRQKKASHVYVLMGDGEQAEGSVWEAIMAAHKFDLDNLTAIVDRNCLQISGATEDIMPLENLWKRYASFGWHIVECDGHDPQAVCRSLTLRIPDTPVMVIANTIKGYGSPVMENKADWHHLIPTDEQYVRIKDDLLKHIGSGK